MESVGETIRRVRLEKKLSIEDLAKRTRVRAEFIDALEEDRYEIFPARAYAVGFLRACARALALDEQDILRRFRADRGEGVPEEDSLWLDESEPEEEGSNRLLPLILVLVVGAVAVVIFFLRR